MDLSTGKPLTGCCTPYRLWSKLLKGGYIKDDIGEYYRVLKGETRSLDYSSDSFVANTRATFLKVDRQSQNRDPLPFSSPAHSKGLMRRKWVPKP